MGQGTPPCLQECDYRISETDFVQGSGGNITIRLAVYTCMLYAVYGIVIVPVQLQVKD